MNRPSIPRFPGLPVAGAVLAWLLWAPPCAEAVPGVTSEEIVLGTHAPLSGPAAPYGDLALAAVAYFRSVNDGGGVHGRRIRLIVRDDRFQPAEAERVVRELVQRERVFAIVAGFGDAPHARVADFLNNQEVPDLFATGGSSAWRQPTQRWNFAFHPSYRQEGRALGAIAARNNAGQRVAVYGQAGELGTQGTLGFREGAGRAVRLVGVFQQSVTAGDLAEQVERLRKSRAEVVALFAVPGLAARFVRAAAKLGWRPVYLLPSVCAEPGIFRRAGRRNLEGAVSLTVLPAADDGRDARVARHRELLKQYAAGLTPSAITLHGQAIAELTVEVLRRAGPALTREGVLRAAESLRGWNAKGQALVHRATLGPEDHEPLNAVRVVVAKNGKWRPRRKWMELPESP
ncbi:MAG: ABC transporter substrate-binding protein [SAR324 cluster bacterium]|nr:ABC transporter substrate-binding protein [SAR324 cluster bacterium]